MDVMELSRMMAESMRALQDQVEQRKAFSAGNDPEPLDIQETLVEEGFGEDECMTIEALKEWLDAKAASIPEGLRDSIIVSTCTDYGCYDDDSTPQIRLTYTRKETPEEVAARLDGWTKFAQRAEDQERGQFERLKAKFGDGA